MAPVVVTLVSLPVRELTVPVKGTVKVMPVPPEVVPVAVTVPATVPVAEVPVRMPDEFQEVIVPVLPELNPPPPVGSVAVMV